MILNIIYIIFIIIFFLKLLWNVFFPAFYCWRSGLSKNEPKSESIDMALIFELSLLIIIVILSLFIDQSKSIFIFMIGFFSIVISYGLCLLIIKLIRNL
jgi:uncharacterized YccA/Bax inhibitor family protein